MSSGIKSLASNLQAMGRGGDKILAHIMPQEAAMLKRMGGSGTVNPRTGLLEFDNPSMGAYDAPSSDTRDSSSSNQSPDYSGSNYSSNSDNYSRDSSSSNQSPSYTSMSGGNNTAPTPTVSTPTVSTGPMPSFSDMASSASSYLQNLGVPTVVKDAFSTAGNSMLNFSDWSNGVISNVYNNPSQTLQSVMQALTPTAPVMPARSVDPWTGKTTINAPDVYSTFDTNAPASPVNRYMATDLNLPTPVGPNPLAPTREVNMYNASFSNEGLPADEEALRERQLMKTSQDMFDEWDGKTVAAAFPDVPNAADYYDVNMSPDLVSFRVNFAPETPTSPAAPQPSVGPYDASSMETSPLPGTQWGGIASFGVTPGEPVSGQSVVALDPMIKALREWAPSSTQGKTDAELKAEMAKNMPEGMSLDPQTGELVNETGLGIDEAIDKFGSYGVKWFNSDVPISQFVAPASSSAVSNYGLTTGPTYIAEAPAAQNIGDMLEQTFNSMDVSQPATSSNVPASPGIVSDAVASARAASAATGMPESVFMASNTLNPAWSTATPENLEAEATAARQVLGNYATNLRPEYLQRLGDAVGIMGMKTGVAMKPESGFRSNEEQAAIYAQGRTAPGDIVTNALPGTSYHNFGIASDMVPAKPTDENYRAWGEAAKEAGLNWGGDFSSLYDPAHTQLGSGSASAAAAALDKGENLTTKIVDAAYKGVTMPYHVLEAAVKDNSLTSVLNAAMEGLSLTPTTTSEEEEVPWWLNTNSSDKDKVPYYQPQKTIPKSEVPEEKAPEEKAPEEPLTTGMDLRRRVYKPNDLDYVETYSPAYT